MKIPLLDLKRQYDSISEYIDNSVLRVIRSTRFIMGEEVDNFESEISAYIGARYAVSCGNGTDALVLALKALNIGFGDEVITSPFTFFATAEAISCVGAKPVFVDVERDTYNIDASKIIQSITEKTKAIIPVHIFGNPADMDPISKIAHEYGLYVIEDACQAIGAEYKGRKVGTLGDIACFSFFPTKNLGAYGDGGIITTNDENIAKVLKGLRMHGSGEAGEEAYNILNSIKSDNSADFSDETIYNPKKYYNYIVGYNSRLDAMQAAILRVKLKKLDSWNIERNKKAEYYTQKMRGINISPQIIPNHSFSAYHLYVIQAENRDEVVAELKNNNISTGIYYPVPLHLQKVYKGLGYKEEDLPNAEYLSHRTFAIPLYPELTNDEQDYIIANVRKAVN